MVSTSVLLFGATGWIGGMLVPLLKSAGCAITPATSRLEDADAVEAELDAIRPERVVLAAGITGRPNVDWCETHVCETQAVNHAGTVALAVACAVRGIHITNFSTGCVFQYDAAHPIGGEPFPEDAYPNYAMSVYSMSKAAAEMETRSRCPTQLLFRIRLPVTADGAPRCLLTKLTSFASVVDIPDSVSVLPSLLPLAAEMIATGDLGVFNLVNPGPVTPADLLQVYQAEVNPAFRFTIAPGSGNGTTKRPHNALGTKKLQARFPSRTLPSAMEAVTHLLRGHKTEHK